jgi:hypothetical protein
MLIQMKSQTPDKVGGRSAAIPLVKCRYYVKVFHTSMHLKDKLKKLVVNMVKRIMYQRQWLSFALHRGPCIIV